MKNLHIKILNCQYNIILNLQDMSHIRIIDHFEDAFKIFDEVKSNNSIIFVHCMMGKSRSATLVIAYLMKSLNMDYEDAYKFVKSHRKIIFPNLGFVRQLKEFESILKNKPFNNNNDPIIEKLIYYDNFK